MTVRRAKRVRSKTGEAYYQWVVDFPWRYPDGRRERIRLDAPINNKKGALEFENRVKGELAAGTFKKPQAKSDEPPRFAAFADTFHAVYAKTNNKHSEAESKKSIIEMHLKPAFGKLRLTDIGRKEIEAFKAAQAELGLKAKTINNQLSVLRTLLTEAIDYGYLSALPRFRWLKTTQADFRFLTFEEAMRLVEAAEPGPWRVMIFTAWQTGMRLGELLGLPRDAVDFTAGTIEVRSAWVRGQETSPKSHKPRHVAMNRLLRPALEQHLATHDAPWVFQDDGERLSKGKTKHPLWRACEGAGLERFGWHVLRHTCASHLVMRGVPLITVRDILGHSTIKMTERYAHLAPDLRTVAVEHLATDLPPIDQILTAPARKQTEPVGNDTTAPLGKALESNGDLRNG